MALYSVVAPFSVDENWSLFKSILVKTINDYIYKEVLAVNSSYPGSDKPTIKRHMGKKDRLHMLYALATLNIGWKLIIKAEEILVVHSYL